MEKEQLQASLLALHQELATVENVDDRTKALLATIVQDIQTVLVGEPAAEEVEASDVDVDTELDAESTEPQHGSDSLRGMVAEFEAEHPKLARAIGQIADGLQSLGI